MRHHLRSLARPDDEAAVRRRLRALRPDSARRWGTMTAGQMVCHLTDSFRFAMGTKAVRDRTSLFRRTAVKWFALYVPLRWPPGLRTTPELDQARGGGTPPAEFAADLAALESLLSTVVAAPRPFQWQRHPIFGEMTDAEWLRWGYLHMDHHLRQFGV